MSENFLDYKNSTEAIYNKIAKVSEDVDKVLCSAKENQILKVECSENSIKKIHDIIKDLGPHFEKIRRQKMKCVFFGQTSNGKSATINGLLGREVLPSSDGRTTSCFITINCCDEDPYFVSDDVRENDIDKLSKVANEICDNHMTIKSHIALYYPFYLCELLNENVQLLDSPGVDFSKENDKWIETYCMDSDIFVYVVNTQATINESERTFFRKVVRFIKSPNIFVAMNKWDLCDIPKNEDRINKIKEQHLATVKEFFCKDLKLDCDERKNTFFISAKEYLDNQGVDVSRKDAKLKARMEEFQRFKDTLSDEMSKRAIKNKFGPHLERANGYISEIEDVLKPFNNLSKRSIQNTLKTKPQLILDMKSIIKEIFDTIIEIEESEMEVNCCIYADWIMMSDQPQFGIKAQILENITKSVLETFAEHIETVITKMKDSFASGSEFQMNNETMDAYLPPSFVEYSKSLQNKFSKNLIKCDSAAQAQYIWKSREISGDGATSFASKLGEAGSSAAMMIMFKHPISAATTVLISSLLSKGSEIYTESAKKKFREEFRKSAVEKLMNQMKTSYRNCQKELENGITDHVDRFYLDNENARMLIKKMADIRTMCVDISNDIQEERCKIISLDDKI